MKDEMRICKFAVVGCGMISKFHIGAIQAIEDTELIGVYDAILQNAIDTAEKYNVRCYEKFDDLLEDSSVDAVCICTPSYLHAPLAYKVIESGKSVLIEKPMALNINDCDKLIALAKEKNVQIGVVSQLRFSDSVSRVKKAVEDGVLGRITRGDLYMKYFRSEDYYKQGGWRGTVEKDGGGALMNQGIHGVDLLTYIMGPIKSIYARSATLIHDIEVEDTLASTVVFQNGALGTIEASTADWPGAPRRIEINGEYGVIVMEENQIIRWEVKGEKSFSMYEQDKNNNQAYQNPSKIDIGGHISQIKNFIGALRGETPLLVTAEDGKRTVEVVLGAYESSASGSVVYL